MGQYVNQRSGDQYGHTSGSRDTGSLSNLYKEHEGQTKINWKNVTGKAQAYKNLTYQVTFRVNYETKPGETVCVLGSLPELGVWKEFKHHMKWTEGNIWESITPLQTHQFYFQYKYSLLQDKGTRQVDWETGVDRLADLELMPDIQDQRNHMRGNTPLSGSDLVQVNNASSLS